MPSRFALSGPDADDNLWLIENKPDGSGRVINLGPSERLGDRPERLLANGEDMDERGRG